MARSAQMLYRVPRIREDSNLSSPKMLNKYGRSPFRLFFPVEAKVLRTPFRARVLQIIYEIVQNELRDSLKSVMVSIWIDPEDELEEAILDLTMVADRDWPALRLIQKKILERIAEEASAWTDEQKEDYRKKIYFELMPLNV